MESMSNNDIKVSVIMPVYNSGKYLSIAVDSILNQSLKEIELILVDDGSTDGSAERCDEYASKDKRVKVIHQKNQGICAARNVALPLSEGDYIAFSDHDDEFAPGLLEDNYNLITSSHSDIVKFGVRRVYFNNGNIYKDNERKLEEQKYNTSDIKKYFWELLAAQAFSTVWDGLYSKKFLQSNSLQFDVKFTSGGEDFDFMLRCMVAGATLQSNSGIYYNHYIRNGFSTSTMFNESVFSTIFYGNKKFCLSLLDLGIDISKHKKEYTSYWLENVLGALCKALNNPNCRWAFSKKNKLLKSLKTGKEYDQCVGMVSTISLIGIVPMKYVLLFFFYKKNMCWACLFMYRVLNKIRRIQ